MRQVPRPALVLAALVVVVVAIGFFDRSRTGVSPVEIPEGLVALGEITAISGTVEHRWPAHVELLPVEKAGGSLHVGELIRTGVNSGVLLTLRNVTQVKFAAESQFVAELDATL
ncbi:MAG: hypothetical protein AAB250_17225, partial [Bdellovibrionota bacterium]